jgi:predicted nuclease of restriction endonuclease-like (RecB) superfamily
MIADQEKTEGWGTKVVEKLARDIKMEFADLKGFSTRNLRYMREFAKAYPGFSILQQPAAKLPAAKKDKKKILQQAAAKIELSINELIWLVPWAHHLVILDKVKDAQNRAFYLQKTVENRWSRNQLAIQIERELHERQGKAINNFKLTLPEPQSDLAHETLKSPYIWDFLGLDEGMREKELEKALISHMREFLLEL